MGMSAQRKISQVNSNAFKVNSEQRRIITQGLRYVAAEAARGEDAKIIAIETGIVVSEIYEYRAARRTPGLSAWYQLLKRRPDLRSHVDRITSGEATPEQVNELIRSFQR